jgi:hypothetical protein
VLLQVFSRFSLGLIFPSDLLDEISMGCVPTKHANHSLRSVGSREAVALANETSCEKVDLPDFVNIATGTPCENLTPSFVRKRSQ